MAEAMDASKRTIYRQLGLHERFCVSRALTGFPPVVVMVVEIDSTSIANDESDIVQTFRQAIETRVDELITLMPILGCHVFDVHTRTPRYARAVSPPTSKDIVSVHQDAESLTTSDVLGEAVRHAASTIDMTTGPLWRVELHTIDTRLRYLTLAIHHVMVDGKGTMNLLQSLLSRDLPDSVRNNAIPKNNLPPISNQEFNMRPTTGFLLKEVWAHLIVPRLPALLRKPLQPPPTWPGPLGAGGLLKPPAQCPSTVQVIFLPAAHVPALKKTAIKNGLRTINDVIHTAFVASLALVAGAETGSKVQLVSETPISLRDPQKHTFASGNFVADLPFSFGSVSQRSAFWAMGRRYRARMTSRKGLRRAKSMMGLLAHIPDPDPATTKLTPAEASTGWEAFWLRKMNDSQPYSATVACSNLGQLPAVDMPGGLRLASLAWAQTPSPCSTAISADVCGFAASGKGIAISIGWRAGTLDDALMSRLSVSLSTVLDLLASDRIPQDATIGQLAELVKAESPSAAVDEKP